MFLYCYVGTKILKNITKHMVQEAPLPQRAQCVCRAQMVYCITFLRRESADG